MIIINLEKVLKEKNKTKYWLSKETGISQNALGRIEKNETTSINFDVLEKILIALDCEIQDVLKHDKDKK